MLQESCTCYIGNLSFYTTETQLWAAFSRFGPVERIVMGLDRHRRTPCGFAFVIYAQKEGADLAVSWLNGTTLDERPIRVDKDHGFREGRQFGRGRSGGQVRDEHRLDYDSGRGGFGRRSDAPGPQGGGARARCRGSPGAAPRWWDCTLCAPSSITPGGTSWRPGGRPSCCAYGAGPSHASSAWTWSALRARVSPRSSRHSSATPRRCGTR